MATVTVNGNTYSDGSNDGGIGLKYLGNNGHRANFVPLISDTVVDLAAKVSASASSASTASASASTATTQASTATTQATNAAASATSASASASTATTKASEAAGSASAASASATTALSVAAQNLTAISATASGTVVASFVYDTTKDSDGGAWRDRCSHLSWYNETLNTATRGATRKFPAVAGIVATATTVTIYDLTDVACPMWRVFSSNSVSPSGLGVLRALANYPITSVFMLNGTMYVGLSAGLGGNNTGLHIFNFIADYAEKVETNTTYSGTVTPLISYIDTSITAGTNKSIVNTDIKCITATVLPTAPIDNATGLPIPTVWVGTLGGVSRIADDGTVSNWTDPTFAYHAVTAVNIYNNNVYILTDNSLSGRYVVIFPTTSTLVNADINSTTYRHFSSIGSESWSSTDTPLYYGGSFSYHRKMSGNAIAFSRSLTLLQPNTTTWGNGLHATITKDFNSGYQFGDIRGAWLCQGTAETLTATDLVTGDSSTFTAGVGSWTVLANCSIAAVSGKLEVTATAAGASAEARLSITTVIGKTYVISVDAEKITGRANAALWCDANGAVVQQSTVGTVTISLSFTAISTTTAIDLYEVTTSASGLAARFDNITVKLAEPDVSYKNNALTVVGSVVKAAVATGCDLMGYSGFTTSNYMMMPYNSAYDFGTGDFHISCWIKPSSVGIVQFILDRGIAGLANNNNLIRIYVNTDNAVYLSTVDSIGASTTAASTPRVVAAIWQKLDIIRASTGAVSFYYNGVFDSTTAGTVRSVTSSVNSIFVGLKADLSVWGVNSLCLLHLSAGAPTAAQIKAAYEKEKLIFVAGNKCLLPGTSNDVKAVDYDDSTDTHHYVTGDYYGAHKGLVRVDSAAGVYTSISAKNGAIIKGA